MGHTAAEGNGMGRNKGLPKQLTEKQELCAQKEELERECALLRGRIFLLMQGEARK